jgi:hypothetical protein
VRALVALLIALGAIVPAVTAASVLVIANLDTPPLDEDTLQKVYLGKVVEVDGHPIIPVNLAKGNVLRNAFMQQYLARDDEKFVAYWTVRRYIGQGTPPREFRTIEEQLEFVRATPGAVGYVDDSVGLRQGLRTLFRKP